MGALEELIAVSRDSDKEGLPLVEVSGSRATITLNRPDHRNRLTPRDIAHITQALDLLEQDSAIRCVILTGLGKVFSAGFDLNVFNDNLVSDSDAGEREIRADDNFFGNFTQRVEDCRVPTILAANGPVYGGGTDLALACDFRFAPEGVKAFLPAARLGIHFYERGLERYVARLGLGAAKRLCLTSETLEQDELLACGFFDQVLPADQLWDRVYELADTLALMAPLAVRGMKTALNQISYGSLDREQTSKNFLQCMNSEDFKEGVTAWAEKRAPRFQGK